MSQAVQDAVKAWAAPILLGALFTLCGILWIDKNQRDDKRFEHLEERASILNNEVIRLKTLQEIP